jgi:NAD-dependent dihydropyrimidine dehydrogenase PreA subunit
MTYVITEACIGTKDESCVAVCPVDCIFEMERMFLIDPAECIDCGACESECPVNAIYLDANVPEALRPFIEINAAAIAGPERVNSLLEACGHTG